MKNILVGCPTSFHKEYALSQYAEAVKSLTYPNYDILLVDNSPDDSYLEKIKSYNLPVIKGHYFESARDRIISSRNLLRQYVLDNKYDYFFSLEQDVLPPKNILERLLQHKKRVISGVYFNYITKGNETLLLPVLWSKVNLNKDLRYLVPPNEIGKGLVKIALAGLGSVLIHKSILNNIVFRYEKEHPSFDDIYFYLDCKEKGINVYADTTLICKHLIKNRPWDWKDIKH